MLNIYQTPPEPDYEIGPKTIILLTIVAIAIGVAGYFIGNDMPLARYCLFPVSAMFLTYAVYSLAALVRKKKEK